MKSRRAYKARFLLIAAALGLSGCAAVSNFLKRKPRVQASSCARDEFGRTNCAGSDASGECVRDIYGNFNCSKP